MEIRYKDLSDWLKAAIVVTWIMAGISLIAFIIGFIQGFAAA